MQPINKIYLHRDGDNHNRIGPNKRNQNYPDLKSIEIELENICPLAVTCDSNPINPPYFKEFNYHDFLGGINLTTMSAEITARMTILAANTPASVTFPIGKVMDKYELNKNIKTYRKIIFLPGSNAVRYIDQPKLQYLLNEDDEWVIKPHPVTTDNIIRDIGSMFGYHRVIDPKQSGITLLNKASIIACTSSSEIYIVARLLGKPVINITRYDNSWITAYYRIVNLLDNSDNDIKIITNILMSDLSGHLRPEYTLERNRELITIYCRKAMCEREKFRMVTNQNLIVGDKTFIDWK